MNAASLLVLGAIVAFSVWAVWRNLKKGAPCECGGSRKLCGCCSRRK